MSVRSSWLSVEISYISTERSMETSNYNCGFIFFFHQFLFHVYWNSIIGICIQDFYVLLMNCLLYHYKIWVFIPKIFLVQKSTLSGINVATPPFFWLVFALYIFSILLVYFCLYIWVKCLGDSMFIFRLFLNFAEMSL